MLRVVGQGQICSVLSAIMRVLWDGSRCHHHLLLHPQCLKFALLVLYIVGSVSSSMCLSLVRLVSYCLWHQQFVFLNFVTDACNVYVGLGPCELWCRVQACVVQYRVNWFIRQCAGGRAYGWGWQGEVPLETLDLRKQHDHDIRHWMWSFLLS
jgi:hypothetical protein